MYGRSQGNTGCQTHEMGAATGAMMVAAGMIVAALMIMLMVMLDIVTRTVLVVYINLIGRTRLPGDNSQDQAKADNKSLHAGASHRFHVNNVNIGGMGVPLTGRDTHRSAVLHHLIGLGVKIAT